MELKELYTALSKAQLQMTHAEKGKTNPAFNSRYAELADVIDATLPLLNANGLCVMQMPMQVGDSYMLKTTLGHVSGQCIEFDTPIVVKDIKNPQSFGSGVTYARRYALSSLCCIAQDDDDGNNANKTPAEKKQEPSKRQKFSDAVLKLAKPDRMKTLLGQMGFEYLSELPESEFTAFYEEMKK
jgi:hypothetical protein